MGIEKGYIKQSMITVSSSRDGNVSPHNSALNSPGAWLANRNDGTQYIQVKFLSPQILTGLITQGNAQTNSFVTSYAIYFSSDGFQWTPYTEVGHEKVFQANTDGHSKATNWFEHAIRAQYIRVVPRTWQGGITMRLELLGCYQGSTTILPPPTRQPHPSSTTNSTNAHHETTQPVNTTGYSHLTPCFHGLDISACPTEGCEDGLFCDGLKCVKKEECTCMVDGQIVLPGRFKESSTCDTCRCVAGEITCSPFRCPQCDHGLSMSVNKTTCECGCEACEIGQYRCGSGVCIANSHRCDGIIDCIDDEIGCASTPMFTPPLGNTATPTIEPHTGMHDNPTTKQHSTITQEPAPCESRWSAFFNRDKPDTGDGDREMLSKNELNSFCGNGKITGIECATSNGIPSYSTGEIMQCSIEGGSVCLNDDNFPVPCSDYKIRYFCTCAESTTIAPGPETTATPVSETSGTVPIIWPTTDHNLSPNRTSTNAVPSVTERTNLCGPSNRQIGSQLPFQNSSQQTIYGVNSYRSNSSPTDKYGSPVTVPNSSSTVTGSTTATPVIAKSSTVTAPVFCKSRWSSWINKDRPTTGDGDRELWSKTEKEAFCGQGYITGIECVSDSGIPSYSTGEIMQCSIEGGSVCLNADNFPVACSDYKIRYFCTCSDTQTPVPSTPVSGNHPPTLQTTKKPPYGDQHATQTLPQYLSTKTHQSTTMLVPVMCKEGWSTWINRDSPNNGTGDIERMTQREMSNFCSGGRMSEIECITSSGIPSYSTGEIISCSVNNGLECLNENNFPVTCSDYKVRYLLSVLMLVYCRVPTLPPPRISTERPTLSPPTGSTQKPEVIITQTLPQSLSTKARPSATMLVPVMCKEGWSTWINRDSPNNGTGDIERMTQHEMSNFCSGGVPTLPPPRISTDRPTLSPPTGSTQKPDVISPNTITAADKTTTDHPMPNHITKIPVTEAPCIPENCPPMIRPTVKAGEVLRIVFDDRGCCTKYEVFCKPEECSPPTLVCPTPMVLQPANPHECCPTYRCMCPPSCPAVQKPNCSHGSETVEIKVGCNCTQFACVSKSSQTSTCTYVGAQNNSVSGSSNATQTYQIGDSWSDGQCKQCACVERLGRAEISCQEKICPVCQLGYKSVRQAGECCGKCEQTGCVINGTVYTVCMHIQ
ncbi:mucin-5AC-like [Mercenaria mercenaria]|uniref:mucin-5AC-like n=1 Tax=Mercenaria mercenaria TaxID=6596 RepID=UPI00234E37DF|nr:mucin-5AC-like [Mercenaria mercenaria]